MRDEEARVVLRREGGFWRDRLRRYKVRLDGEWVGKLREREDLRVDVRPGTHEIQVKLDWGTSPSRSLQLAPGEVARLRCGPGSFLGLVVPGRYLILEGDDRSTRLGRADRPQDISDDIWDDDGQ